ncbi:MAG: efflux transporter outer membrane subunit [Phycisphaerales bacterium]|nr:efflux transporter outer membrane subunit [Phycisphaerales bacterium]
MARFQAQISSSSRLAAAIFTGGLATTLCIQGCMVGPDYAPPQPVMPDSWHVALVDGLEADQADPGAWWRNFNDEMLVELVTLAEQRNLDLRSAVSAIQEARAQYGVAASDLYPQLSLNSSAEFTDGNRRTPTFDPATGGIDYQDQAYNMGLDLGWEVDLWGKVRRSMQAADASVQYQVEYWRDILITVRAEVAMSYIGARSYQLQVKALQKSIDSLRSTRDLVQQKYDLGVANEISLAEAEASLAEAVAQMPPLVEGEATAINRLSVLVGETPGPLRDRLAETAPVPQPPAEIGVGIPGDVIRRRPDIRQAERQLAEATASIGVAEAALLPSLQIQGSGGFSSSQFSQWFDGSSLGGLLGISVSWPFFTAGRLESVVDVRNEQAKQALYAYELTVLNAIGDVENTLISYLQSLQARRDLEATVVAYERVVTLAADRYATGIDSLDTLLYNERLLMNAQQNLAVVEGQVSTNAVMLYKALGGGWEVVPEGTEGRETVAADESKNGNTEVSG